MWVVGRLRKDERVRRRTPGSPIGLPDLGDCGGPREAPTRSRAAKGRTCDPHSHSASEPLDRAVLSVPLRIVGNLAES